MSRNISWDVDIATFPVFISHTYYVRIVKNDQEVTKIVPIILIMMIIKTGLCVCAVGPMRLTDEIKLNCDFFFVTFTYLKCNNLFSNRL